MDLICVGLLNQLARFSEDTCISSESLVHFLRTQNTDYRQRFGHLEVRQAKCTLISYEKAFFSNVFQIVVQFVETDYECVLKVPLINALGEENSQNIISAHNNECEFYEHFSDIPSFILPRIFEIQKIPHEIHHGQIGFILMESFVGRAEALDLYGEPTEGQILSAARSIAQFQFHARDPKREKWWRQKEKTICLDELYSVFIPTFYPTIDQRPEFVHLIPKLKPLLNPKFGFYALRELPEKYDAITLVHGDFQSHNLMFRYSPNGQVSDDLATIIDWQLVFWGTSLHDLGKLLAMSLNHERREAIKQRAFDEYYKELIRVYTSAGMSPPFLYEQGFELYELVICHTATVLLEFLPYMEQIHGHKKEWSERLKVFSLRVQKLAESVIPLIEKYGLDRLSE